MKKGISLVALVITIVVLIILTAAVVLTINNDSIFDKADEAVKKQNELEAYSAVQMEVMQIRLQNIGEPIGKKFAGLLQDRLNEKYPSANAAVEYKDDEIGISYTLNGKKYKMVLAKGYKLTMEDGSVPGNGGDNGENTPGSATIEEERAILQAIFDKFPDGIDSIETFISELPEGWTMSEELFMDLPYVQTSGGNTFYVMGDGIAFEQIGVDLPSWVYNGETMCYTGKDTKILLEDNTILTNAYKWATVGEDIMCLEKITDTKASQYSDYSFSGNRVIEELDIKLTNLILSKETFDGCESLTTLKISSPIEVFSGTYGCSNLKNVELPDALKNIGNSAFSGCSSLQNIIIPENVTYIGSSAFRDCSSLPTINIPDSVKTIGQQAFSSCSSLTNVTIPNSVTTIENEAFRGTAITTITIPNQVTKIGPWTFANCSKLTTVIIPSSVTSIDKDAFAIAPLSTITVGSEAVEKLLTDIGISADIITIDSTIG